MKKPTIIFLLLFAGYSYADEWLAAAVGDVDQRAVAHAVVVDGQPEVIVERQLSRNGRYVLFWNVTDIETAQFEIWAIDAQGRRSKDSAPFELLAGPIVQSDFKIIVE